MSLVNKTLYGIVVSLPSTTCPHLKTLTHPIIAPATCGGPGSWELMPPYQLQHSGKRALYLSWAAL